MNQPDVNDESTMYNIPQRLKIVLANKEYLEIPHTPLDLSHP